MATELAKAYVQIIPSAKGIQGQITQELAGAGASAGATAGSKIGSAIKGFIAKAGIGLAIKAAVSEGANLEQSIGGIETLFKDNASKVRQYADEAYKTAGLSANDYMQSVTGFSASLLQGLGGDTGKAAEVANMAMVDMSDNANKFGSDMGSIQYAYQGFAKQNYTMLDNLKLGYGGTKEEMARLLSDAQKITGVKYDMGNLSDVYNAIHVIQGQLDITGTTAKEAASTLSGSLASMKSAWKNVLGAVSTGAGIGQAVSGLKDTVISFAGNLLPMLSNIIGDLPSELIGIISGVMPVLLPEIVNALSGILQSLAIVLPKMLNDIIGLIPAIMQVIQTGIPSLLADGVTILTSIIQGIVTTIPALAAQLPTIINTISTALTSSVGTILTAAVQLLTAVIDAIPIIIPPLAAALPSIIKNVVSALVDNIGTIIDASFTMLYGVIDAIPILIAALAPELPSIIWTIVTSIARATPEILSATLKALGGILGAIPRILGSVGASAASIGLNLVKGIWNGISDAAGWVMDKIRGFGQTVLDGIKAIFGIHSPSRVMRDQIGKNLMLGLAGGIEGNTDAVSAAIDDVTAMTTGTLQSNLSVSAKATDTAEQADGDRLTQVLTLLYTLLGKMGTWKVVLDSGETIGWIDKELSKKSKTAERGLA